MSFVKHKDSLEVSMDVSDVCSAEDAVRALLEHMVDPVLPIKSSPLVTPTQSQQQEVAKQVHAIVLLYNYYHRKQYPNLEALGFYPFCHLVVILKPALLAHLKFMKLSNHKELDDLENQLSLVEKTIMKACDISRVLETSGEVPNIVGWPITKVAVFLVDSKKENCVLQFSSITQGVWSLIEKDIEVSHQLLENAFGEKLAEKKRRLIQKPTMTKSNANLTSFKELAFSAVKEAIGITRIDLAILEEHVVYSLSKEKEAAYFYIMQCTQSVGDAIQVPINDVIDSLQGPLFKKDYGRWAVTRVVEYFHVLPYGGILSEWMDRLKSPRKSAMHKVEDCSHVKGEIQKDWSSKTTSTYLESANMMRMNGFSGSYSQCNDIPHTSQLDITQKVITFTTSTNDLHGEPRGLENKFEPVDLETMTVKIAHGNEISHNISSEQYGTSNLQIVTRQPNSKHSEKIQITIDASKAKMLSQAAMEVLMRRRNNLSMQMRNIQDDIAECEGKIQMIRDGSDDNFTLKMESLIEGCSDVFRSIDTQEKTHQVSQDQLSLQYNKRERFPEATMCNPCHELDAVCSSNKWILPTYHISPQEGGFRAYIAVKGTGFDCSNEGDLHSNPREARESAAAKMLVKLHSIEGSRYFA